MRVACFTVMIFAGLATAQAPSLPPEQAREGWLMLWDGESLAGWITDGSVAVKDGSITLDDGARLIWKGVVPTGAEVDLASAKGVAMTTANGQLILHAQKGETGSVKGIRLLPRNAKALFNGKNLDGWNIHPGKKSKFSVDEGLLTIVDGPGDLQTAGSFKNFLLQLECKTNGKHLNSGVFFRCRPNEYQNGYEAQIHNGFTAEPMKDYLVDQFDPKTHAPLEKLKVKSAAIDFGTGAIYRRLPARKAVARDGEWFTLTVLADGNHLATWVNGVPTVDWFDNRAPSDNARTGYRAAGGHISLQGHDPTTNLSFRDIRIVELPE